MNTNPPQQVDIESLSQWSKEELVEIVIEQGNVIVTLQKTIIELQQEIERLKISRDLDSKNSSKPPFGDILKKSEKKIEDIKQDPNTPKRKPGGQLGHQGKTRKGFGRVDRFEILRPDICSCCGHQAFAGEPAKIETQQVAQLVERPIEIVEYHRHTSKCSHCGNLPASKLVTRDSTGSRYRSKTASAFRMDK